MAWYAIYEAVSGQLVSFGEFELPPVNLAEGHLSLLLLSQPDMSQVMWDETLRIFVARPAKVIVDRWDDFQTHPFFSDWFNWYQGLNATNKTRFRNALLWAMDRQRYRSQASDPTKVSE